MPGSTWGSCSGDETPSISNLLWLMPVSTWGSCSGDETPSISDLSWSLAHFPLSATASDVGLWPGGSWFCQGLEIYSPWASVPGRLQVVSDILWPKLCEAWRLKQAWALKTSRMQRTRLWCSLQMGWSLTVSKCVLSTRMNGNIETPHAARVGWEWAITCGSPRMLVCDVYGFYYFHVVATKCKCVCNCQTKYTLI